MNQIPPDLVRRLLFILHRGLTEVRNLACQENEQIADLADALEILPGIIDCWQDDHIDLIRSILRTYEDKYPTAYDYLAYLDQYQPPQRF
jgi:hypothetical protein